MKKWAVDESMDNNTILKKLEAFLGDIIKSYIKINRLQKSKKRSRVEAILKIDPDRDIDHLYCQSRKYLDNLLLALSQNRVFISCSGSESKYIIYVDELTRFISYGGKRARTLIKLRTLMVAGYVALEKIKESQTYNEAFYERYGSIIKPKYTHATLKNPGKWSRFKDFIYEAVFIALQGGQIDIKSFRKEFKLYLKRLK